MTYTRADLAAFAKEAEARMLDYATAGTARIGYAMAQPEQIAIAANYATVAMALRAMAERREV